MNRVRLAISTVSGAAVGVLAGASAAAAHVDAEPVEIAAGVPVTVTLVVEHGCGDLDTTGMLIQVPPGVTDMVAVEQPGWTTAADAATVSFAGGPLDHHTTGRFAVSFTAPVIAGPLDLPVVQQCGDTALRWIEIPEVGGPEPENPAPRVNVVGEAPAQTTTIVTTTVPETTVAPVDATTTTGAPGTTDDEESTTTEALIAPAPDTTAHAGDDDEDDDGLGAWPIVIGVVIVAGAGAALATVSSRRRSASAERPGER